LIINGHARARLWRTHQPGTLTLSSILGNWSVFVAAGPVHATLPATGIYSPFGPWAMQTTGSYQCHAKGTSVVYTPDPRFAPITLTRVSA
jgi:hypothetical protein